MIVSVSAKEIVHVLGTARFAIHAVLNVMAFVDVHKWKYQVSKPGVVDWIYLHSYCTNLDTIKLFYSD